MTVMPAVPAGQVQTMSFADYLALDDEQHRHAEFVEGVLVDVNPPHGLHQRAARNLLFALTAASPPAYEVLVEWGWVTSPGRRVREPDLMVVSSDLVNATVLAEPPLLAVEIVSPDSGVRDLFDKREEYAAAGLRRYLVASPDPAAPALVYFEAEGDVLRERQFVAGQTPLRLPDPFDGRVSLVPADLARPR